MPDHATDEIVLELQRIRLLLVLHNRDRVLVGRGEAAELMGVSLRSFDKHVAPYLPIVWVGTRVMYRPEELKRWASHQEEQTLAPHTRT